MPWIFQTKDFDLSASFRDLMEQKLTKACRIVPQEFQNGEVLLKKIHRKDNRNYVCQLTLQYGDVFVRAEDSQEKMQASFEIALEKFSRQLTRHKDKTARQQSKHVDETMIEKAMEVKRRKKVGLKSLFLNDAIHQMELLGHDFYVFRNSDTQKTNVVYRRDDGGYGVLEED